MKSILTIPSFLLLLFSTVFLNAQITTSSQWTWMKGDSTINPIGVYGTKGVAAAANKPNPRNRHSTWTDNSGNIWIFGGNGCSCQDLNVLNDLWKYSPSTNQWTWVSGDSTKNGLGVYGTKGTPSSSNTPRASCASASWTDTAGNLWLFGGGTYDYGGLKFNDLWKFDISINQWTWVSGDSSANQSGVYGVQGTPSVTNKPGARSQSAFWTDANGKMWLFGGQGFLGFNDLWKYDPITNQWTWMKGNNTESQTSGVFGTMGTPAVSNTPGALVGSSSWIDDAGKLWLFGGNLTSGNLFNTLWKYDPLTNNWTWIKGSNTANAPTVYGTKGVPSATNTPGSTYGSIKWKDSYGNFWLYSGWASGDLWKYNVATNQWTWMKGYQPRLYGTMGVPNEANSPSSRFYSSGWTDAVGNLWLFGGYGNDLWKLSNVISGPPNLTINDVSDNEGNSSTTIYTFTISLSAPAPTGGVTFDIATANGTATAGSDYVTKSLTGQTIAAGNSTYTFDVQVNGDTTTEPNETFFVNVTNATNTAITDGEGFGTIINDDTLNSYITISSQWTWMKGDSTINPVGIYGTKGVAAAANTPGARNGHITWTDNSGNFWLFGGYGGGQFGTVLNDLWKYNISTNQWTWVTGDSTKNGVGVYGTKGIASPSNTPRSRTNGASWTDATGNLWLFGGGESNFSGFKLNDLWKFNSSTNQWTWVSGDSTANQSGVYGVQGTPSATNKPGGRTDAASWTDADGNFWLFGGMSFLGFNDLWKYNPITNQWTWMKGNNTESQTSGVFGTMGTPAPSNNPGSLFGTSSWTDEAGKLWLFGGRLTSSGDPFNTLWKYDPLTNNWTWIKGSNIANASAVYGIMGVPAATNTPRSTYASNKWKDSYGNFWLYSGSTSADLWKYNVATNQWTWMKGYQPSRYGTMGIPNEANSPSSRFYSSGWIDAVGNLWLFGGYGYSNDLWRLGATNVSFVSVNNGAWNNPSTWAGGVVPSANSIVTVRHNITVQANASCYSLKIEGPNGFVTVATGIQFMVLH